MICLNVKLLAKAGEEQKIAGLFPALQAESRKEPGCLMYVVHQHAEEPRRFLVYEQYRDEEALAVHRNSHHFQHYATRQIYPLVESREAELYRPL